MLPTQKGALRLFQFAGINVYLHWSWFIVALIELNYRHKQYSTPVWNVVEYLALFLIVLCHEFGHSLACRQTGGQADTIVLWPLGGVAYVSPPQRPGAMLWSIAAGPLVNIILVPVTLGLLFLGTSLGWRSNAQDAYRFVETLALINGVLLIFNLLPVYPLDGGQILRSLLWFIVGRARSLIIATAVGLVGVAALGAYAIYTRSIWTGILAFFMGSNCWRSLQYAQLLRRIESAPARAEATCPACHTSPPLGPIWLCQNCRAPFDAFETHAVCPNCQQQQPLTSCIHCGAVRPITEWLQGRG